MKTGKSVAAWQATFREIYGLRNRMRTSADRILLRLQREIGKLAECVRKDGPDVEKSLAGIAARIFALANWFDLDLDNLIRRKYPGRCYYCGKTQDCSCLDLARAPLSTVSAFVISMSLDDLQTMLRRIYGKTNESQGRARVFNHLSEELAELTEAVLEGNFTSLKEEIADLFAWWIAYVNLQEVPSADALLFQFYPNVCSRCGHNPCAPDGTCPPL